MILPALAIGAAAWAGSLAWSWTDEGATYRLEGGLEFAEPVALELDEYAPRVDGLQLIARTWCAPGGKGLRCVIQDARIKAVTTPLNWGRTEAVLQDLQLAIEGSALELRLGERGHIRKIKGLSYDGDRQTEALHDALLETLFWSLDLQTPADPGAGTWTQEDTLQSLDARLEHARAAPIPEHPSDQHVALSSQGSDRIQGSYVFDDDRGLLLRSSLRVDLAPAAGALITVDAYVVTPSARTAAATFMKTGSGQEPDM